MTLTLTLALSLDFAFVFISSSGLSLLNFYHLVTTLGTTTWESRKDHNLFWSF